MIDPVVTYSTYLGGTGRENSVGVGVDAAGNIYAARQSWPQVVKLSADGQTLLYSVTLGDMRPFGLVADAAGNAYVVSTCPYDFADVQFVCPTLKSLTSGRPTVSGRCRHLRHQARPHGRDPLLDVGRARWQCPAGRHCHR